MSKRGSSHGLPPTRPDYTAAEPAGPPPPSPLDEAARAAAAAPNPIPQPDTSKGALEGPTSWVPAPLQPAAMLAVGMAKAAWTVAVPLARFAYRLLVWSSPVLIWAGTKYISWAYLGWLTKAKTWVSWGRWILSWFIKTGGGAAA